MNRPVAGFPSFPPAPSVWAALAVWAALVLLVGCASTPPYQKADCPVFDELGVLRANPAGALDRHLAVEASFQVCPPDVGLAEIKRRRIELKHEMLALLSAKTEAELSDPLRVEKLQRQLLEMANQRVMRKGRVVAVYITAFELE